MKKIIIIGILLGLVAFFYYIDPAHTWWVPKCPFYYLTGFQCPACGTQRALYHLAHLQVREAITYNPFLFVSLPYLAALCCAEGRDKGKIAGRLRAFCYDRRVVRLYLILILAWWIGRNAVRLAG